MKFRLLLVLALVSAGLIASRFTRTPPAEPRPTAPVQRGDIFRSVTASGKIEPRMKVQIKSKVSGIVRMVSVREGDVVKKDQVLLDLDRDYLESQYKGSRAALNVAEAMEREAQADIANSEARLEQARSEANIKRHELAFSENEYARKQKMFEQGLISRSEVELAEKQSNQARANLASSASGVNAADAQLKRTLLGVGRAKAGVTQALASTEIAQEELQSASIRSPIDGVVLTRHVEVGDAIASILTQGAIAPLLFELGDTSQLYVKALVNEADISQIRLRQPVLLNVESYRGRRFHGMVTKIAPLGNEKNNVTTFELEISVTDGAGLLRANMSVTAEIVLESRKNVLLLPESAIRYESGQPTVEVAETAGVTRRLPIEIGISDGIHSEVRSGLQEGQKVVDRR